MNFNEYNLAVVDIDEIMKSEVCIINMQLFTY